MSATVEAAPLRLYSIFHLNLAYSSIELEQRAKVIERCYWPLLRLAKELDFFPGIELSGYTLSVANEIAPDWVDELRRLVRRGRCELIGSGYSQLIGPLVPAALNAANQRLGQQAYADRLGVRPSIALVNEQAYSGGLVAHYLEAGYRAIAMEWNNPAAHHPEWPRALRYAPQRALGPDGRSIDLLWIDTIAFQQLQRYAHGELDRAEYQAYLEAQLAPRWDAEPRAFPLYGNDAEIFDLRPGRFHTESEIDASGEWQRMRELIADLARDARFELVPPSRVLDLLESSAGGRSLRLESAENPVPVKKQEKYNVSRWAVTGKDDLQINTACWRLHRLLRDCEPCSDDLLRKLCYLWSSDFRTHITPARWRAYRSELDAVGRSTPASRPVSELTGKHDPVARERVVLEPLGDVRRRGRFLELHTDAVRAVLDCRRGLAIRSLAFLHLGEEALLGTIPHGYYEDIPLAADFYSGHSVVEFPGAGRVTDLNPTEPSWQTWVCGARRGIRVSASVETPLGAVTKTFEVCAGEPRVRLVYEFDWDTPQHGTFRTGFVTVLPEAFDRSSLFYRTHNGGAQAETFLLQGRDVCHGSAVSSLVSARSGLGATEGLVTLGDARRQIHVRFDPAEAAALPMVEYRDVADVYWLRLVFSLGELDETRALRGTEQKPEPAPRFSLEISGASS